MGWQLNYGKVSVEFEEDGTAVPILYVDFDFSRMDKIEEEAREILKAGKMLAPFINACARSKTEDVKWATISGILRTILESDKPALSTWLLGYSFAVLADQGLTIAKIGKRFKVTKQGAHQRLSRLVESIGIKNATYGARSEESRAAMSKSNRSNICK